MQLKIVYSIITTINSPGWMARFDEAVYRLAQIVHDSNAPVMPVLFSWPSRGEVRLVAYTGVLLKT